MSLARRLPCALAAALMLPALDAAGADAAAERAAIDKAGASMQWLANYSCPALGLPPSVKGMQTEAEVAAQIDSSWAYAQGRLEAVRVALAQREEVLRKAKPGDDHGDTLAALDEGLKASSARAATALINWSLGNWIELAKLDPAYAYPPSGAHPMARYVKRETELRNFVIRFERLPGGQEFLAPVAAKFHQCLLLTQNQIVERNAESIRAAAAAMASSSDAARISQPYGVVDPGFAGPGVEVPPTIQALQAQADKLLQRERAEAEARRQAEQEREERERQRQAKNAPPAAKGGKTATAPPAAAQDPDADANLRAASGLVQALGNRSVSAALQYMHDEVSLSSALGQARGKSQVSSALQQGFASGRSGSLGAPYANGSGQIVADVQSPRGAATMYFRFRDRLVLSLQIR